jgi:AraC-like DNA-binding protein
MTGSRQAPLLNPLAAGFAGLLDEIEGVQAWAKDRQGRYRWVNRGFLLNYALESAAQVIGCTDHDLSPAHLADQYRRDDDRVMAGEPVKSRIELVGRFDRTVVWSHTTKRPLMDGRGRIVGTIGMTRVIDPAAVDEGGTEAALGRVLIHMRTHIAERLTNPELARIAVRSVRAFERMFRRHMHVTPQCFLRRLRIRLTCQALTAGREPLAAVAAAHGFYDQSHFVREFRREIGVTPGEYRARRAILEDRK